MADALLSTLRIVVQETSGELTCFHRSYLSAHVAESLLTASITLTFVLIFGADKPCRGSIHRKFERSFVPEELGIWCGSRPMRSLGFSMSSLLLSMAIDCSSNWSLSFSDLDFDIKLHGNAFRWLVARLDGSCNSFCCLIQPID